MAVLRKQCVEILYQTVEKRQPLSAVKALFEKKDLPFANMLLLTTLRRMEILRQILEKFLHKKIPEKNKEIYYCLLLGASEILYLNTPAYAVINEYVNIAKKKANRFVAGMVNAVLRQISKQKENLNTVFKETLLPDNFLQILTVDYTKEQIKKIKASLDLMPPTDITTKENPLLWAQKLNGVLFSNGTIRLAKSDKISEMEGFEQGQWWVQDLAASLPVLLLGNVKNKKVLDLCAAPGGKTAQLLAAGAKVTALDVDATRMEKLRENIKRLQLEENLTTVVSDAVSFLDNCQEFFEIIIVDAPCSATGTFRRHPEVLYNKSLNDVKGQSGLQKVFLQKAAGRLLTGGKILYCTCSIAKEEGEYQIESFLNENPDFVLCAADIKLLWRYEGIKLDENIIDKGVLRTLPYYMENAGGMDAFFAACLEKK